MTFHVPENLRVKDGPMPSDASFGNNGVFKLRFKKRYLNVIASDGDGWEHVSVSMPDKIPSWEMMCLVKSRFWDDEDAVMQLHPPKSQWISNHNYCLHLWRPINLSIPLPPMYMVGYQSLGTLVK